MQQGLSAVDIAAADKTADRHNSETETAVAEPTAAVHTAFAVHHTAAEQADSAHY